MVTVLRMFCLPNAGSLKAFVDICFDHTIVVKGLRVLEGRKGLFVTMPREQGKDNKWCDQVQILNSSVLEEVNTKVLREYCAMSGYMVPEVSKPMDNTWNNLI